MLLFNSYYWRGGSNRLYHLHIYKPNDELPEEGGIYVFVRRRLFFFLKPLYVGKAASLRDRLNGHERWEEGRKRGANERHILVIKTEKKRRCVEEDLIRYLKPRLNDMLVPRDGNDAPNTPHLQEGWMSARDYWSLNDKPADRPARKRLDRNRTTARNYWGRGNKAA